jgi:DNA-binding protein HU-alpha
MTEETEAAPAKKPRAKRAKAATAAAAAPADAEAAPADGNRLRRKELIARVVAKSGAKRGEVTKIVEATLAVLGDALQAGEALVLPPLGNLQVRKRADAPEGSPLTLKLRRGGKGKKKEALAEAAAAE